MVIQGFAQVNILELLTEKLVNDSRCMLIWTTVFHHSEPLYVISHCGPNPWSLLKNQNCTSHENLRILKFFFCNHHDLH